MKSRKQNIMKKLVILFLLVAGSLYVNSQCKEGWMWSLSSDEKSDVTESKVTTAPDGSVFTLIFMIDKDFYIDGKMYPCLGTSGLVLTKHDKNGNFEWAKSMGGVGISSLGGVEVDNQGYVYVAGTAGSGYFDFNSEKKKYSDNEHTCAFVIKLNPEGNYVWMRVTGVNGHPTQKGFQLIQALALDEYANVYVGGEFQSGVIDLGGKVGNSESEPGNRNAFTAKLDSSGKGKWLKVVDGGGNKYIQDITIDEFGNVYTGIKLYGHAYFANDTAKTNDDFDGIILKYDENGNEVWMLHNNVYGSNYMTTMKANKHGYIYVVGRFLNSVGKFRVGKSNVRYEEVGAIIYIFKMDLDMNPVWITGGGVYSGFLPFDMEFDIEENFYVAGYAAGSDTITKIGDIKTKVKDSINNYENSNIFKFDSSGNFITNYYLSGKRNNSFGIDIDDEGDILVTGRYKLLEPLSFDTITIGNPNSTERNGFMLYIAKLNNLFQIALDKKDILCHGDQDGEIELFAAGGQKPYNISWDHGGSDTYLQNLDAGLYRVTVTDNRNCTRKRKVTITEPDSFLMMDATVKDDSNNLCIGSAEVIVSGGSWPYTYKWDDSPGSETAKVSGLCKGTYTVTVTDSGGCVKDTSLIVGNKTVSIKDEEGNLQLLIYPNPATDKVFIESTKSNLNQVQIYSGEGKLIFDRTYKNQNLIEVSTSKFHKGIYLLKVSTSEGSFVRNLVIE